MLSIAKHLANVSRKKIKLPLREILHYVQDDNTK